jgi:hypothetical protein
LDLFRILWVGSLYQLEQNAPTELGSVERMILHYDGLEKNAPAELGSVERVILH